jgi:hypothetical protein
MSWGVVGRLCGAAWRRETWDEAPTPTYPRPPRPPRPPPPVLPPPPLPPPRLPTPWVRRRALEETLSAIVMQAEQLLVERQQAAILTFLPLFNRTVNLLESRRDPANGLFLIGNAANLLAPSDGGYLLPNGTRAYAYLTGAAVTYVAVMDRLIELRTLVGDSGGAAQDAQRRAATLAALPRLLAPSGDYFVKHLDPDGTMHGVLGQAAHGYIDAVVNHDAVAFGVADRVVPGLGEAIMARLLGPSVPAPGLRPYTFVITNAAGWVVGEGVV